MLGFGLSVEPQLWALVFVMVRIGAAFVAAPVFGAVSIPLPVRISLSGAIGVLVLAVHPVVPPAEIFGVATILSVAAEALIGLAIGFVLQIAFAAPMIASEVIGTSMGIGFASAIDPQNGRSTPALGQFLSVLMTLLFLSVNGHLVLVDMLVRSYTILPPGGAWLAP
ncbi:MAG: fliR [Sphingomonas bacterium]|nr:fliR [Sphingomonas bacterium]